MAQSAAAGGNGNAASKEPAAAAGINDNAASKEPAAAAGTNDRLLLDLRKYLLLLAILAATVTYVAGLNPPGGVWLDTQGGHLTGNQILVVTYHARYNAFSYSNATAFMASAVVTLLLLLEVKESHKKHLLVALRIVMSLDMLALVAAYAAGASRDTATTVLASLLVFPIFVYVVLHTVMDSEMSKLLSRRLGLDNCLPCPPEDCTKSNLPEESTESNPPQESTENKKRRKILMLLAIFATTVTYTAGLNPPGGFWPVAQDGHRAGDPVLQDHHRHRFLAFFICNTASFVASLSVIMMLLTEQFIIKKFLSPRVANAVPYGLMVISLLGLVGAYAAGSCRETRCTTGVPVLYMVGLALVYFAWMWLPHRPCFGWDMGSQGDEDRTNNQTAPKENDPAQDRPGLIHNFDGLKKARALVLLLATLAATVTHQAGLNPPGGFWPDDRDGHKGGDPILLSKHAMRYRVFFYCNSMALAASLVVIFMVMRNCLNNNSTKDIKAVVALVTVMILDLICLMGAFAAGCCRDVSTSIYVVALAGGTLVYVVFHMVFFAQHSHDNLHEVYSDDVEKKRKRLLLLAILAATLTYQAGLTPPGGFWLMDGEPGHHAGDPVLLSNYPRRYAAFFYLNATGFMASVALIILLVNPNLYRAGIKCHALHVCLVAGIFGLMGAYAAGSSRHVRTSIYMIALIGGAVLIFVIILLLLIKHYWRRSAGGHNLEMGPEGGNTSNTEPTGNIGPHTQRKYLMLLGILAASVSYQAGLAPPGGVWPENSDGHAVGNPILRDSNHRRYHIFLYCNSTSFVASMVVITLQLVVELINGRFLPERKYQPDQKFLVNAAHWTMVVDLLGLLGAYAAGSSREWETSGYIVALVAAVASYIGIHLLCLKCRR